MENDLTTVRFEIVLCMISEAPKPYELLKEFLKDTKKSKKSWKATHKFQQKLGINPAFSFGVPICLRILWFFLREYRKRTH